MGIEPTGREVDSRPNGFEDRGHHQVYRHFLDDSSADVRFPQRWKQSRRSRGTEAAIIQIVGQLLGYQISDLVTRGVDRGVIDICGLRSY